MMKKLYFVRHGLSEMNIAGIWSGTTETPLSDVGKEQALTAGEAVKSLQIDTIVCSTLGRAVETAQIIADQIDYPLSNITQSKLLIERHFGVLEGTPYNADHDIDSVEGIEPTETLFARARVALDWVNTLSGDNILIVSHGSTGRALRHVNDPTIPFHGAGHFKNAEVVQFI